MSLHHLRTKALPLCVNPTNPHTFTYMLQSQHDYYHKSKASPKQNGTLPGSVQRGTR